jgi:hypothetical protein
MGKLFALLLLGTAVQAAPVSDRPDTPFKLATFEAGGKARLGMLVAGTERLLDIAEANARLERTEGLPPVAMPADMRALIEEYPRVSPRLYQIANFYRSAPHEVAFSFPAREAAIKAPIKYPWNLVAAAANYKSHAQEMSRPAAGPGTGPGGFQAVAVDVDAEDPHSFAKSPRSCIIDPENRRDSGG